MNWTEQTESMMKMWNDAQKQFLSGGYNPAQGMPGLSGMPTMQNPMNWFKPGFMPGLAGLGAGNSGAADSQAAAGNLLATQAMMMQGFGILTKAWQAMAPDLSTGKPSGDQPWKANFDAFLKQLGDEFSGVPGRFSASGMGMKELMGSFLGEWGPLLKPWLASIQGTGLGGPMAEMFMGEQFPFQKMFDMGAEPAFQDLAQIPMMGVSREQIAKISRVFDSHVDLRKAAYKYQTAISKAIGEAIKETIEKLAELAKKDQQIGSVRELMSLWVKTTDKKLTRTYITDEFIAIQSEMSKASLENKNAQRAVLEIILKQLDIPTRTELDDAYKTLYNLKKGVKELRVDTTDARDSQKQAVAEMMELRNARKQAESRAEELRDTARRLETELASLRDAMRKMETKFAQDITKLAESVKTPEPVKNTSQSPKAPEPPNANPSPKPAAPPPIATGATQNKGAENKAGESPTKIARKKAPT
uniref:Poly(3-hydroxyalkanoate) polymerase subunit PhaE n=1 Tax=Candidatus Kentrum sp. SD TaxID=2126332 RepID=A0A451BQA0_9GAMM|nr:MAG: poly(R)-hydroxyalkanoic acid synthase, class III, PhaE subunit [Candidatus Kentron sp. SD]